MKCMSVLWSYIKLKGLSKTKKKSIFSLKNYSVFSLLRTEKKRAEIK